MSRFSIHVARTGDLLCPQAEAATNFWTRFRGLLGRTQLREDEGLWIVPSSGIHTFWMKFALDIVFLDHAYRVLATYKEVSPGRIIAPRVSAASALELPTGVLVQHEIVLGDVLVFERLA